MLMIIKIISDFEKIQVDAVPFVFLDTVVLAISL